MKLETDNSEVGNDILTEFIITNEIQNNQVSLYEYEKMLFELTRELNKARLALFKINKDIEILKKELQNLESAMEDSGKIQILQPELFMTLKEIEVSSDKIAKFELAMQDPSYAQIVKPTLYYTIKESELYNVLNRIQDIDIEINKLKLNKKSLRVIQTHKKPSSSQLPIKPKPKRDIFLSSIMGFLILTFLALFLEKIGHIRKNINA